MEEQVREELEYQQVKYKNDSNPSCSKYFKLDFDYQDEEAACI